MLHELSRITVVHRACRVEGPLLTLSLTGWTGLSPMGGLSLNVTKQ